MNIRSYINGYIENIKDDVDIYDIYKIISNYYMVNMNDFILNYLHNEISDNDIKAIKKMLDKYYVEKIPIQYITGYQFFYNEKYIVNNNTLIPRQDTEILVDVAISYINKNRLRYCMDMCTGTGAVGISIAKNSDISKVILVDISKEALDVANNNIILNNIEDKCVALNSNLFINIKDGTKIDILVSNPPYIKTGVLGTLDEYVKKEPILALDGGVTGLDIYNKILDNAKPFLNDNSYIIFEIGYDQKQDIINLINKYSYEYIETLKDLEGRDRVVVCRFHQI